jgi:hypothetical protein
MSIINNDNDNYNQQCELRELVDNVLSNTKSDVNNPKTGIRLFANIIKADDNREERKETRQEKKRKETRKEKRQEKKRKETKNKRDKKRKAKKKL